MREKTNYLSRGGTVHVSESNSHDDMFIMTDVDKRTGLRKTSFWTLNASKSAILEMYPPD